MKFINFLNKYKCFILFLLFGLVIFTYPMLLSGFDLMPGDGSDVKFFGYLLEHSRLWLLRVPTHEYLWNAPFYYPHENTLAYSDAIIGVMPIYWVLRIFWSELSSLQAVFVAMCVLNYSTFYYFLNSKKCKLAYSPLASSLASFIFAFGLMRYYRMSHLNYYCQFYSILALIFLFMADKNNSKLKNGIYFTLSAVFLSLQFYSCYTLGFYFCIITFFMLMISLCFKIPRNVIIGYLEKFYIYIICSLILLFISLIALVAHYLSVEQIRTLESVMVHMNNSFVWIRNLSILDNFFIKDPFYINYFFKHEASASVGVITTIFAFIGMYKMKNSRWILYITSFLIFILSCSFFGYSIWQLLYYVVPGCQGIRVVVRISFIALIIICIALAAYIDSYKDKLNTAKNKVILILSILFICLEQIPYSKNDVTTWSTFDWSKKVFQQQIEESVKAVPDGYKSIKFSMYSDDGYYPSDANSYDYFKTFEISNAVQSLAMWTALKKNIYCVNGMTGIFIDIRNSHYENMYETFMGFNVRKFDNEKYMLGK